MAIDSHCSHTSVLKDRKKEIGRGLLHEICSEPGEGENNLDGSMREAGVNNVQLARRLGVRETVIRRMLDPDHATRSDKIQAALAALGKRFPVIVEDAA